MGADDARMGTAESASTCSLARSMRLSDAMPGASRCSRRSSPPRSRRNLRLAGEGLEVVRQDFRMGQTLGIRDGLRLMICHPPHTTGVLACENVPLANMRAVPCSEQLSGPVHATIRPGQRMSDPVSGLEILCTRAGAGALTFGGRRLMPNSGGMSAATTAPLSRVADRLRAMEEGQLVRVRVRNPFVPPLCVTKRDGCYLGVADSCSHGRARLSDGTLAGVVVMCPLHGASFDMRTGRAMKAGWEPVVSFDVAVNAYRVTARRRGRRVLETIARAFRVYRASAWRRWSTPSSTAPKTLPILSNETEVRWGWLRGRRASQPTRPDRQGQRPDEQTGGPAGPATGRAQEEARCDGQRGDSRTQ